MVLTSFLGGATDPQIVSKSEGEIIDIVESDHSKVLGMTGTPVATAIWRHLKALPQYNLGHLHAVEAIRDAQRTAPGVFFAGNYLEGPSVGKCVENGFRTAEAVSDYVKRTSA